MRVLSIFLGDETGGFTKRLYMLYEALAEAHDKVHFIGSEAIPVNATGVFQHLSKAPKCSSGAALFWIRFMGVSIVGSFVLARRYRIDRIVNFGAFYTALCMAPIVLLNIPAVTFIRADNMLHSRNRLRNTFFYLADWIGIKLSRKIIFNSETLKHKYVRRYGIKAKELEIIPNNIESAFSISPVDRATIRAQLGVSDDDFLISSSGVLNPGKNFSFLVNAMRTLASHRVKLVIVGDELHPNGERAKIELLARQLGVASSVLIAGWKEDPRPFIACSDLFAFPSRHEGSPNALLEALSCGIPCFGSNIDEIKEILCHRLLLFSPDEPEMLAKMVLELIYSEAHYDYVRELSNTRREAFAFDWRSRTALAVRCASS